MHFPRSIRKKGFEERGWRTRQNVVWLWGAVTFAAGLDESAMMKLPSLVPTLVM